LSHDPSPFSFLVIFRMGSYIFSWAVLDCDPPIYAFPAAGMTGVHDHT
jgi:hypothetical protein